MDSLIDPDKLRFFPLNDKSNFTLWRIRVWAATSSRGLNDVFGNIFPEDQVKFTERKQQASNIILNALSDPALRVVRSVGENPRDMLVNLNATYDMESTASKISRMSEMVSVRYTSLRYDIAKHINRLSGIIEKLRSMGTNLQDSVVIGILISSIQMTELALVTASVKTISERDLK